MSFIKYVSGVILAGYFAIGGCSVEQKQAEPFHSFSGVVIKENLKTRVMDSDIYTASIKTDDNQIRIINCRGDFESTEIDAVIGIGDKVRFESNSPAVNPEFCIDELVELNGSQIVK